MTEYWRDKEKIKTSLQKIISEYEDKLNSFDPEWQDSLEIEMQRIRYQYVYDDLMTDRLVTLPVKTFKDTFSLDMGDLVFNLIYFGRAHSGSDILIFVPELKLLMTGDLFSEGGRPAFNIEERKENGRRIRVKKWIEHRMDNIENVINGHGCILGKNDLAAFINNIRNAQGGQLNSF
jgi:glyoxylase-like metal-dependent hydrolase (beta-lactamase superfamily II)